MKQSKRALAVLMIFATSVFPTFAQGEISIGMEALAEAARISEEKLGIQADPELYALCETIVELKESGISDETIKMMLNADRSFFGSWYALTDAEKTLVIFYPDHAIHVNSARNYAATRAEVLYPSRYGSGEEKDAFRHAMWNGAMMLSIGGTIGNVANVKRWADAHEELSPTYFSTIFACGFSGQMHTTMDLANNEMGRNQWRSSTESRDVIENRIKAQVNNQRFYYLHADAACNPDGIK